MLLSSMAEVHTRLAFGYEGPGAVDADGFIRGVDVVSHLTLEVDSRLVRHESTRLVVQGRPVVDARDLTLTCADRWVGKYSTN